MIDMPQTPVFYVAVYLLIGVLWTAWQWKGAIGKFHAMGRQRYGHLADTMLIAPIILWPVTMVLFLCRILRLLPTSWKVKDRTCWCGGEYRTTQAYIDHSGLVGKLLVKCMKCKKAAELFGDVEIENPEEKK